MFLVPPLAENCNVNPSKDGVVDGADDGRVAVTVEGKSRKSPSAASMPQWGL